MEKMEKEFREGKPIYLNVKVKMYGHGGLTPRSDILKKQHKRSKYFLMGMLISIIQSQCGC